MATSAIILPLTKQRHGSRGVLITSRIKLATWSTLIHLLVYVLILSNAKGCIENITYVEDAVAKGGVCLDGSPPAYRISPGFGSGVNNWIVHLENTNLHYRGARVWLAVMEDLLAKGMSNAENALLSGCSAGGLASILHCDSFRSLFQKGVRVKCLSDGGFFINVKDITGTEYIKDYYNDVVNTHGSARNLASCNSRQGSSMCFFPQYMAQSIQTPLFILNAAYDSWQIPNILVPDSADPTGIWNDCKHNIQKCSPSQLQTIQDFRIEFLNALASIGSSSSTGMFINSCYAHCQAGNPLPGTWFGADSPVLDNLTIAEAVGNWFYDRSSFQKIDCAYPCDTSCPSSFSYYGNHRSDHHSSPDSLSYPETLVASE